MNDIVLPLGWSKQLLEECLDFVIGGDWGKDPEFEGESYLDVKCIRGSEFKNWKIDKGKTASPRKVKASSLEKRRLSEGDILLEISGGGPDQPVGRTELIDDSVLAYDSDTPKIPTNFLRLLRPIELMDSSYLNYYLKNFYASGEVVRFQSGSNNLRNLQFKDYVKILIPTPPLNEQTRIANKLDELLAQVDTIKARVDAIPAILKRFRQSVLAAAVSGKLTEKWRESRNKKDWGQEELESLASNIVDCPHSTPKWTESGKYCVRTTAFKPFKLDVDDLKYVSTETYNARITRLKPLPGDILYSREGAILGVACQIPAGIELCLGQRMIVIRASERIEAQYLTIVLNSDHIYRIIRHKIIGNAAPRVNMSEIKRFSIPLPEVDEQKKIISLVEENFLFADQIQQRVKDAQSRINNLTQSILAKAFRGELVPQDPSDEPASELLERIKKEREQAAALTKATKKVTKKKAKAE